MQTGRTLALACLVLGAEVGPAEAYMLSLRPIGGTAVSGVGYVGDTVVVGIDVALEASDVVKIVAPSLQWDLEGGNVLDLVRATESQGVAGGALGPVNGAYRQGAVGTLGDYFADGSSFPSHVGPTFVVGWEQAGLPWGSLKNPAGPASFRVGTATFVFSEVGATTLGFLVDPDDPWKTFVIDQVGIDETGTRPTRSSISQRSSSRRSR